MQPIPTKLFSINTDTKYFVSEFSDIEGNGYELGETITLVSELGNTAVFQRTAVEHDEEGDLISWVYKPTQQALAANRRLEGWSVTVFND